MELTTTITNPTTTQSAINEMTGEAPRMLQVFTVPQRCDAQHELVAANTRASNGVTIAAADKMRCIIIPQLAVDNVPSKFQSLVMDALRRTAKKQLDAMWKKEPQLRSVPAAVWSVDSLLLFAAQEAESTRLTKANCEDWFIASQLCSHLMQQNNVKKYESWKARILSLSAPVIAMNSEQCTITIAAIGKFDEDASTLIGGQMIAKLQARIEALAKANEEIEEI